MRYGQDHMERERNLDERHRERGSRNRRSTGDGHEARMVKVIEVVAESEHSWEDAADRALYEASKSVRNIKSVYVKDMQAIVENDRIVAFRINAKISFGLEDESAGEYGRSRRFD